MILRARTIGILAAVALFGLSCHSITEVTPDPAEAGADVTISGSGFGSTQGAGRVLYDGEELDVLSWSDGEIVATLPSAKRGGQYELTVETRSDSVSVPHTLHGSTDDMVFVEAGVFPMGGDSGSLSLPVHLVYLDAFHIDRTEVTAGAFQECIDDGGCEPLLESTGCNVGRPGKEDHAANCLHWIDAAGYCAWTGKRLPTEAEWEKAARGTDGRIYPWGNEPPTCEYAVIHDPAAGGTACGDEDFGGQPVGSRPLGASPYGALDMAGNTWELVADWFGAFYYEASPPANPPGPESGQAHVIRGGAWNWTGNSGVHRVDFRVSEGTTPGPVGFRCARDA